MSSEAIAYMPTSDPIGKQAIIKSYKTRFWILFVFSMVSFYQGMLWNTWGPITDSMAVAFPGWGPATTAMLSNWGAITLVLFLCPMSWFMSLKGLREPVVFCVSLIAVGTTLRCFSDNTDFFMTMGHISAIMIGTAGTVVMCCAAMVPATWFPPKERITATAVIISINQLGVTGSYLEPLLVVAPGPEIPPEDVKRSVMNLMFIEAGIAVLLLIAVVSYFPAHPPSPPSISSSKERLHFILAIKQMFGNRNLRLVFASFTMACSVPWAWLGVLNYSLEGLGMDQNQAMGIGLAVTFAQCVVSVLAGRLTDIMYGHLKVTLIALIIVTCSFGYWFGLLSWGVIPSSLWQIYMSTVGIFGFNHACTPLFVEYAVEMAYPCPEQTVIATLYTVMDIVSSIFIIIFAVVPHGSYGWMVYCLLASCSMSLFPLLLSKENYARTKLDEGAPK